MIKSFRTSSLLKIFGLTAVVFAAAFFSPISAEAAAPTFNSFSAIAASTGADVTVTLPAHQAGDIILLLGWVRDVNDSVTITTATGWTQLATWDRGTSSRYWLFWKRATSGSETNPVFNKSGSNGDTYAAAITYRGANTSGDPWEVLGAASTGTADPSTISGITTLTDESLVVVPVGGEDNNNASIITTGTNPSAYTEHYVEDNTGSDGAITFSEAARTTAGATGNVSVNWNSGSPVGWGGIVLSLKPVPVTTTTGLTSNNNPSIYGSSVTFTATVTPSGDGAPSGTVTFKNGGVTMGTGTLNNANPGVATYATTTLNVINSPHSITAVYEGDNHRSTSTSSAVSQVVTQKALTVSGITASNKQYDRLTTAAINTLSASLVGVISPDSVTLNTGSATGSFADKNVGTAKTVTIAGLTISGTHSGNYSLTQPSATANITAKGISVTGVTAEDKDYDGNTNAVVSAVGASLVGVISGDAVSLNSASATGSFDTAEVGTDKLVTISGLSLSGLDGTNYSLSQPTTTATIRNPIPTTTSISPSSATAGDPGFVITVYGTKFLPNSVVRFGGEDRVTTHINSTQVTAVILASDIAVAGNYNVRVFNPAPGGGLSNAQLFTVNAFQNPVPTTTSISPASKTVGDSQFTMTVNGTNFVSNSTVNFNGSPRTTSFVSSVQLTATIPASDLTVATSSALITVANPAPGGGTSNAQTFTVNAAPTNPFPTTTSISPTSVTVGGSNFTLTVNGANFITNSVVQFNGSNRVTAFASSTQLTATITASDISSIGSFDIAVFNPTPGGGTSNIQVLSVVAAPDNMAPVVTAFVIPSTSSSVFVPITTFTATDNIGVTGYLITESASTPLVNDQNWSVNVPTSFNVVTQGTKTLYAWVKDAVGNISSSLSASVTVTFVEVSLNNFQNLFTNGTIVSVGSVSSTNQITFNQEVHVVFTGGTTIVIPFNTNMNTGASVDFSQLTGTTSVSTVDLSADYIAVGAVNFGLPSISLTTSQPVTISIATDTAYNGQSMDVFKKEIGGSTWTQTTTCTVNNGVCSFTSLGFSSFVLGRPILAPAAISNLAASNPTTSSATLTWTAPGNIGNNGTAMLYDLRYSNSNITSANFSAATQVSGMPAPLVAGTQQSKTISGLSENTTYYFAIKTSNSIGFTSGISNIAQITLGAVPAIPSVPSSGALSFNRPTSVIFSGLAYPGGKVKIYRKSSIEDIISSDYLPTFDIDVTESGQFAKQFIGLFEYNYLFALEPIDRDGRSGGIRTYITTLTAGNGLAIENIFMPPTINLDSVSITKGKGLIISGYATPGSAIEIKVDNVLDYKTMAGTDGRYRLSINTQRFGTKDHFITARQVDAEGKKSDYSSMKNFTVSLLAYPRADLNGDGSINVGDWSMFLSRWNSTSGDLKVSLDMNGDDKVDVADLSIFFKALKGE